MTISEILSSFTDAIIKEELSFGEETVYVQKSKLKEILAYLKKHQGFQVLLDLSGVDYTTPKVKTDVFYWLHNPETMARVRIIVEIERDETIPSITDIWQGADWYERELYDLFGVVFENHPDLKRILMPDDWIGHPLRKDYALTEEPVEFKHGVQPKVPSEVIPHATRN